MIKYDAVTISGSPSPLSKSGALGEYARNFLEYAGLRTRGINVRDLPAQDLFDGNIESDPIQYSRGLIQSARAVVVLTPIYKSSYSGLLKTFIDLLPNDALAGKVVLPIALGVTSAQLVSVDYALKPVLAALGARDIIGGIYAQESLIEWTEEKRLLLDDELKLSLHSNLRALADVVLA